MLLAGRPADQGGGARGLYRFEGAAGAETHVRSGVDAEDDIALTFFAEYLEMRDIGAGRDQPVHVADIVAFPVLADFVEIQSGTTEYRGVQAGKGGIDKVMCRDTQGAGLVTQFQQVIKLRVKTHGDATNNA